MTQRGGLRFNLIRAYCFVVVDASIILHHIFSEEKFRPKIEYFIDSSKKEKINCEILPKTTYEVNKRIVEAANEYSKILSNCRRHVEEIARKPLSDLTIDRNLANLVERAFAETFKGISKKYSRRRKQKTAKIRLARIVETAFMMELWNVLTSSTKLNMEQFFQNLKDSFGDVYKDFSLKQSMLMKEIGAVTIDKSQIPETTKRLVEMFSKRCRIRNPSDVAFLCEATGRMYKTNKWCVVVTTDYGDMVQNDVQIRRLTLLTVCDPLYFLYRLDSKLDLGLQPKSVAAKLKILYARFFKSTKPVGVV